jgi:hypothetical protein
MYFAYLDYSKSILLIRKQGYVIENDNNMIPHLKRKTQLSQSLYDDNNKCFCYCCNTSLLLYLG